MRRLPPLNALRAFEAAARHLSFTKAAAELNVTPAAVSQQVKTLEEYFGVRLFTRLTRALLLTEPAQRVLPALQEGFDRLAEADDLLRDSTTDNILTVSAAPTFSIKWLVGRLERFREAQPGFDVRIDANDQLVDFRRDDADVAVRFGRGKYRGLKAERLFLEIVVPVCAPRLLTGPHPIRTPADLVHHRLIHVDWQSGGEASPNWPMWLQAAGAGEVDAKRGPRFNEESLAIMAACDGQGVALASLPLASDDLKAGRLVRAFPHMDDQMTAFGYYIVCPPNHLERPKVQAFWQWITEEASLMTTHMDA